MQGFRKAFLRRSKTDRKRRPDHYCRTDNDGQEARLTPALCN